MTFFKIGSRCLCEPFCHCSLLFTVSFNAAHGCAAKEEAKKLGLPLPVRAHIDDQKRLEIHLPGHPKGKDGKKCEVRDS
jgi:hypothetical protein